MRRCIPLLLCLLAPLTASANPVQIDGTSLLAFCIVAFLAFVVEAGIVALLLAFRGLAPLRAFAAYFIGNARALAFRGSQPDQYPTDGSRSQLCHPHQRSNVQVPAPK